MLQRLDDLGIAERDIQTSLVRLQPMREEPEQPGERPAITGYQATTILSVTIDEIAEAGQLLAEVVAAGANQVEGIEFQLSDRGDLLSQARADAIADARRAAEQLAGAAEAAVGQLLTITDQAAVGPGFPAPAGLGGAEAAAVPIAPGEQTVQVNVRVSFALEPEQPPAEGQ